MKVPSSRTATRHVTLLGKGAKREYFQLREKYKGQGLSPREAIERAYTELNIHKRWQECRLRMVMGDAFEDGVPLTDDEARAVDSSYAPLKSAKAEHIGEQDMALAEQVKWAQKQAARVQNGAAPPTRFPCEGALFWYQSAVANRREFEKLLLRVEAPGGDPDNLYLQDSQHQYAEIEKQVKMALEEVGNKWEEYAKEFKEKHGDERQ